MRFIYVIVVLLFASCSLLENDLRNAISYGEIIELNEYTDSVDKQLFARLYRSPVFQNDCFKETHGVCQYQYFLSVSSFDEYPETNIYRISEKGEIGKIEWIDSPEIDTAIIEITINKYTKEALVNNADLPPEFSLLRITVTPKHMEESLTRLAN